MRGIRDDGGRRSEDSRIQAGLGRKLPLPTSALWKYQQQAHEYRSRRDRYTKQTGQDRVYTCKPVPPNDYAIVSLPDDIGSPKK